MSGVVWPVMMFLLAVGGAAGSDKNRVGQETLDQESPERIIRRTLRPIDSLQWERGRLDVLSEGFEDTVPPAGWTIMTSGQGNTWAQSSSHYHTGAHSAFVRRSAPGQWQDEWLITPALDFTGLASPKLEFYERELYWTLGLRHSVAVSTTVPDDPMAFTAILVMTPGDHEISQWEDPVLLDLSDYAGMSPVYLAFRYEGQEADNWYVDDVRVFDPTHYDATAVSAAPSGEILTPDAEVTPQCVVRNLGLNTVSFDVNMTILHNDIEVYSETEAVVDLAFSDFATVEFPTFTAEVGYYHLTATTLLRDDEQPENDSTEAQSECYSGQRTPLGILYTNWACGPCVPANQALDNWYPSQGNSACLIRVHVWWPSPLDPIYLANPSQSEYMHHMAPELITGVPWLFMDNYINVYDLDWNWGWPEAVEVAYAASAATPSPLFLLISYEEGNSRLQVWVDIFDLLNPTGDYRLYAAVTEDSVYAPGPNGERYHNQAFRFLYPDADGIPIDPAIGQTEYWIDLPLAPEWEFGRLRATVFVRGLANGPVLNSATMFLSEGPVTIGEHGGAEEVPRHTALLEAASPNPFNPGTTISFMLAHSQPVNISVYDVGGHHIATLSRAVLEAGRHAVAWNGTDDAGHDVGSGTYMVYMKAEDGVRSTKITLVR